MKYTVMITTARAMQVTADTEEKAIELVRESLIQTGQIQPYSPVKFEVAHEAEPFSKECSSQAAEVHSAE